MIYPQISTSIPDASQQIFQAGKHSWSKPVGASLLYFAIFGAGAGGGGGYAAVGGGGGSGGTGGQYIFLWIPAIFVPDSLYLSVGSGGAGGDPGTPGSNGTAGGATSLILPQTGGTLYNCNGGNPGNAGAATAGGSAPTATGTPVANFFTSFGNAVFRAGGTGGAGGTSSGTSVTISSPAIGGAGGGGTGSGGTVVSPWVLPIRSKVGSSPQHNGSPFIGYGGFGGGPATGGITLDGGSGSLACGGGGGGGAGTTSGGRGGSGGNGYIIIASM